MPRQNRDFGAALLLLVLVFVTYGNSFAGGFLGDSGAVVLEDPRVHEISRDNLNLIFRQQYWPDRDPERLESYVQ
jgi:hypothetical protein